MINGALEAKVIGRVQASFYIDMLTEKFPDADFSAWDERFPGWREEDVLYLEYDNPQKQGTFGEYWQARKGYVDFETAEKEYEALPLLTRMAVPHLAVKEYLVNE